LRKIACFLLAATLLALPAAGQDSEKDDPVNPITMGKGPQDGDLVPAWIFYWLLGGSSVVCAGLLVALRALWNKLNDERLAKDAPGLTAEEHAMLKALHDAHAAKDADGVPRWYMPRRLPAAITKLTELAQDTLEKLGKLGDAREDRQTLRSAFDSEKAQMRKLYTEEIKSLQGQLHQEQRERREESAQLWQKNDATTREVMTVIRDMIVALENATKVIEAYHEAEDA
jgi:hypothetical protein